MFRVTISVGALMLASLSALADQPARSGSHAPPDRGTVSAAADLGGGKCAPGLAKKVPACVPPGHAKATRPIIGRILARDRVHLVTRPGLYGLGIPPRGSRYGVVDGQLVRLEQGTWRVQSIIRRVNAILD